MPYQVLHELNRIGKRFDMDMTFAKSRAATARGNVVKHGIASFN